MRATIGFPNTKHKLCDGQNLNNAVLPADL